MKWTLWPRSDNSRPSSEPTIPLPPYVGKTVMPMFIRMGSGEWGVGSGEWGLLPTAHYPLPTLSGIHIHSPGQQRDGVFDVQSFADEESFAAFDSDQRAEVTVTSFYFAHEGLRADARL